MRCPYTRVFPAPPMLWKKKAEIGREHSLTEEYYLDSAFLFIHRWKPAEFGIPRPERQDRWALGDSGFFWLFEDEGRAPETGKSSQEP